MPNQRSASKVRVTVPMDKTLEAMLARLAEVTNKNRVELICEACEQFIKDTNKKLIKYTKDNGTGTPKTTGGKTRKKSK